MKKIRNITYFLIISFCATFCKHNQQNNISEFRLSKGVDSILSNASLKDKYIDSLHKRIISEGDDTLKLNTLVKVGRVLKANMLHIVLSEAISQAKKIDYQEGLLAAAVSKEYQFGYDMNFDSATYYFEMIKELAAKEKRMDFVASAMINYAMAHERKEFFKRSDSILLKALNVMKEFRISSKRLKAHALYLLGQNKNMEFENAGALSYLKEAADYAVSDKSYDLAGNIYFRMGECYIMESDYNNALSAYGKSVDYCRKSGDEMTLSSDLSAIGEIYMQKEDYKKAYKNLFESLYMARKTHYTYQEAYTSAVLGSVYEIDTNYTEALRYLNLSNKLFKSFNQSRHESEILMNELNIGSVYVSTGEYEEGMKYLSRVYEKVNPDEEPALASELLSVMADAHMNSGDLKTAEEKANKALIFAKRIESMVAIRDDYKLLFRIFEKKKMFEKALFYHKKYISLADSLSNKTQIKKTAEWENLMNESKLRATHDKAETNLRNEKAQKENELKRQRITSIVISIGLLLMVILSFFIYRSLKENKRKTNIISEQKKEVEKQKHIIEEREKEVKDSITYAKRIQDAILPGDDNIRELFSEAFILYRPKDIVAGDFYWLAEKENVVLIAVADCTGHGVPGAMVSVVCSNALNRSVNEFGLRDPGLILDKTREIVIETFERSGSEVKDGMDISLIAIPKTRNKDSVNIKWAGANNPLWYTSNNSILEIKGNKQPVGKFIRQTAFTTQSLELRHNEILYLITDGFADQFGGPKGKKFKYKQLIETLSSVSGKPLTEQKEFLRDVFEKWKAELEQVDDVTIIGLKI